MPKIEAKFLRPCTFQWNHLLLWPGSPAPPSSTTPIQDAHISSLELFSTHSFPTEDNPSSKTTIQDCLSDRCQNRIEKNYAQAMYLPMERWQLRLIRYIFKVVCMCVHLCMYVCVCAGLIFLRYLPIASFNNSSLK